MRADPPGRVRTGSSTFYGLLKTILDNWQDAFAERFDRKATHKARRLVSQLFDARNATSHLHLPLSDAESLSYLHAMSELATLAQSAAADVGAAQSRL